MNTQSDRLGIDFLSGFNMSPVALVKAAAELGCQNVSVALEPFPTKLIGYEQWSLRSDKQLRRELLGAMREHNVNISTGEVFLIKPGVEFRKTAGPDLELMRELNIQRVTMVGIERDIARVIDESGVLVAMAAELDMQVTLEFCPYLGISNLNDALKVLEAVDHPNLKLTVDAMHFFRSGGTVNDLLTLDPNRIGYVQLCDAPMMSKFDQYMYEVSNERLPPGQGEFPLSDFLRAIPRDVAIGLEIPMLTRALAGEGLRERLQGAVTAAKAMLEHL